MITGLLRNIERTSLLGLPFSEVRRLRVPTGRICDLNVAKARRVQQGWYNAMWRQQASARKAVDQPV